MTGYFDYIDNTLMITPFLGIAWSDHSTSVQFSWLFWDAGVVFIRQRGHI